MVKATPQPSTQYGDTVCVAGLDLGLDPPKWLRLYPVPFRYLDGANQFKKYDIIRVRTREAGADKRPESRKIEATSIVTIGHAQGWRARAELIKGLQDPSMCELIDATRQNMNAQSLAAIRPAGVTGLEFRPHPGWSPGEAARMEAYRVQDSLFDEATPTSLQPPRLLVTLRYRCETPRCGGHEQRIIDWELTALQARYRGRSEEELKTAITRNFLTLPFGPDRAPLILVGNQENVQRRSSFTTLGLYYPRHSDVEPTERLF
jgi:hypothetical protein